MKFYLHKLILALSVIFISLCPFSIFAEETVFTIIYGGEADPNNFIFPRYTTNIDISTEGACDVLASLTAEQRNAIINRDSNYNLIYVDSSNQLYFGKGIWVWAEGSTITLYGSSAVSDNGVYPVNSDGSIGSKLSDDNAVLDISTLLLWEATMGGSATAITPFNVLNEGCAIFQSFNVILSASPSDSGTVSGGGTYDYNTTITIDAAPNDNYRFTSWSDGNTENPRSLTVTNNVNLTANFESTIVSPNLQLPSVTLPTQTINTEQNTYLNTNSSDAVKGGSINLFQIDYYNIYTVVQTAESDQFFDSRNDNYYVYQESSDGIGHYIFAVYDYSKLYVFAPNMSVSSNGFTLTYSEAHNIKYSYASSNGLIQRDVSKFEFEYVDNTLAEYYGYNKLPFNNSSDNKNKLEWIGTRTKMLNGQASSMSASLTLNTGTIMTNLHFVITDTTNSYENAQMMNNQTIINNNMNQNFENLNQTIFDGDTETQQVVSNNDTQNAELDSTIAEYDQLEQGFKNDMDESLNDIDMTFDFGNITDFTNTALFVRTHFGNLVNDNPIGQLLGFSLMVGISLLIIGKRL